MPPRFSALSRASLTKSPSATSSAAKLSCSASNGQECILRDDLAVCSRASGASLCQQEPSTSACIAMISTNAPRPMSSQPKSKTPDDYYNHFIKKAQNDLDGAIDELVSDIRKSMKLAEQ